MFETLNKYSLFFFFLVFILIFVYGCSSNVDIPVVQGVGNNVGKQEVRANKNKITYHYVRKKETLYSISWQYGLDYKELAKLNEIFPPYIIKVGERLNLKTIRYKNTKSKGRTSTYKKIVATKAYSSKNKNKKNKKNKNNNKNKTSNLGYKNKFNWVWPVKGKLYRRFSPSKGKKGIDILVKNASNVKASESGKVVYSGHGLTGYGLLIIIKHNNKYLSAYAHNSKLLIEEGQKVKRNQVIALSGKSSSERFKLHFEIRKNGKPVNPLKYLPK